MLPLGHGVHSLEVSEKFSLKVFTGHFAHSAPAPVLEKGLQLFAVQLSETHLSQPGLQPGMQVQSLSGANFSGETSRGAATTS